ncbi:MAG: hypothetical protein ACK5XA_08455 [Tagaea sp.]
MSGRKVSEAEREQARARLRELLPPGATAHTILRHRSRSGMSRRISIVVPDKDGELLCVDWLAAQVLGWPCNGNGEGIKVGGCGMDMGFHLVYSLSHSLYRADDDGGRGGYTLKHRWL